MIFSIERLESLFSLSSSIVDEKIFIFITDSLERFLLDSQRGIGKAKKNGKAITCS